MNKKTKRELLAQAREQQQYESVLRETLYETVHNLRHLINLLSWTPPPAGSNEYDGCRLAGEPPLDFRYTEQLLAFPHVERLERDTPAVLGFLDHALRNVRYMDRQGTRDRTGALIGRRRSRGLESEVLAKPAAYTAEHLLRVLACVRYRSELEAAPARIAGALLETVKLDGDLNPGEKLAGLPTDVELRDRIRFVQHDKGEDHRQVDTTVALFKPDGKATCLFSRLKGMDDPPPRPSRSGP